MHSRMAKLPGLQGHGISCHASIAGKTFRRATRKRRNVSAGCKTKLRRCSPAKSEYIDNTSEFDEVKAKLAWAQRPVLRRHAPGEGNQSWPVLRRARTRQEMRSKLRSKTRRGG